MLLSEVRLVKTGSVAGRGTLARTQPSSCRRLGSELSEETHAEKARGFTGKGLLGEEQGVRGPRGTALPCGLQSQVYGDEMSFWVVSGQSFGLRVLPGGASIVQPRWVPARRILGDW